MEDTKLTTLVPLLSGAKNYLLWSVKFKAWAASRGFADLLVTTRIPADEDAEEDTEEEKKGKLKRREARARLDAQALGAMTLRLADSELHLALEAKTAKELWDNIAKVYSKGDTQSEMLKMRELVSLRMSEGDSVISYVGKFKTLSYELNSMGRKLDETFLCVLLMSSLPSSYDVLVTNLESIPISEITLEVIMRKLQLEGQKREAKKELEADFREGETSAFMANDPKRRNRSRQDPKKDPCHNCGKRGHWKKECWQPGGGAYKRGPKSKGREKMANVASHALFEVGALQAGACKSDVWAIDSGATMHMTHNRRILTDYVENPKPVPIAVAKTGMYVYSIGTGLLEADFKLSDGSIRHVRLTKVFLVPEITKNLLSVSAITSRGGAVEFGKRGVKIKDRIGEAMFGEPCEGLFVVQPIVRHQTHLTSKSPSDPWLRWHRRFGHLGSNNMKRLARQEMVTGLDLNIGDPSVFCNACCVGKSHKYPSSRRSERAGSVLDKIHTDICGPMQTPTVSGYKYFVTFIDDHSRMCFVYPMRARNEVFKIFKDFLAIAERQTGRKIRVIKNDGAKEYMSKVFETYLKRRGIAREISIAYAHQQMGLAERKNRTLQERALAMLVDASLPLKYWMESVSTANLLANMCPSEAISDGKTPYEIWHKKKPNVSLLRAFGCLGYAHVPKETRKKMSHKAIECILLGYDRGGYRLVKRKDERIIISRDVTFDETQLPGLVSGGGVVVMRDDDPLEAQSWEGSQDSAEPGEGGTQAPIRSNREEKVGYPSKEVDENKITNPEGVQDKFCDADGKIEGQKDVNEGNRTRKGREIKLPSKYAEYEVGVMEEAVHHKVNLVHGIDVPKSYEEAMVSPQRVEWIRAMESEMEDHEKHGTFRLCRLPDGKRVIGCKWVYDLKLNPDGSVQRYKARLVAKGYSQREGIDYEETFAPVARVTSARILIALATERNWDLEHVDVRVAFLNGNMKEEVYVEQPPGFRTEEAKSVSDRMVCQLRKALYGTKQASRNWNQALHQVLIRNNFYRLESDHCMYKKGCNEDIVLLLVWVDDIILTGSSTCMLKETKSILKKEFECRDLGPLTHFIGWHIIRDREGKRTMLSQANYIERLLSDSRMSNCKPAATPQSMERLTKNIPRGDNESSTTKLLGQKYRFLLGKLLYAATGTRPDIAAAVGVCSRFMQSPSSQHYTALKRILRYLHGTVNFGITYDGESYGEQKSNLELEGYADADWAGDPDDRRSTTGYVFNLCNGPVSWSSSKQQTVAMSTVEAEYQSAAAASREAIWIRNLLEEIYVPQRGATTIYDDNQGCINLSKNPKIHSRAKHIDIKHHFLRERVEREEIKLVYCAGENMIADLMKKPLTSKRFEQLRNELNITRTGGASAEGGVLCSGQTDA